MILRGIRVNAILTEIGLVPVVRVHAKVKLTDEQGPRRAGDYIPKTVDLDDLEIRMPDGSTRTPHTSQPTTALRR